MSMRKSTRQELRKCRELIRHLIRGKICWFCKKPLMDDESYAKDGDGQGSPISRLITIHHKDGNHKNDEKKNKKLAHTSCHKSYHMKERWKKQKKERKHAKH